MKSSIKKEKPNINGLFINDRTGTVVLRTYSDSCVIVHKGEDSNDETFIGKELNIRLSDKVWVPFKGSVTIES